jgi:hypothetical protein
LSCWLFEFSKLNETLRSLTASYRQQFKVMTDKTLNDEEKQKLLLSLVSQQLLGIGKLILGILLFIAPFLSLFILQNFYPDLNPDILITWWGLLIPIGTVFLYILIKKYYGVLFGKR